MKEIREMGERKIYKVGFGYFLFLLIAAIMILPMTALGILFTIAFFGYFAIVLVPFLLILSIWQILVLVSALWWRLTLSVEGLEYRVLGCSIFAKWSDVKTIVSWGWASEYVIVERCTIQGNLLFGLLGPGSSAMSIPLSGGPLKLWGKNVVPDILAFAQASKSK